MADKIAAGTTRKKKNELLSFLRYMLRRPGYTVGLIIVATSIFLIFFGTALAPYPPEMSFSGLERQPPSAAHIFGTDSVGMDVFSRVLAGTKIDVTIALVGTFLSVVIGIPLGLVIGYYKNFISELIARALDLIQSIPVFVLAMVLVAVRGGGIINIIMAIAFVNAPIYARMMRGQTLEQKGKSYVEASRCAGNSDAVIIFKHILPNGLTPIFAQATVNLGMAIMLSAGISFIGAGVKSPTAEWGLMVSMGTNEIILGQWWTSFFPGVAIAITVLGYSLLGDALQHYLDPLERKD